MTPREDVLSSPLSDCVLEKKMQTASMTLLRRCLLQSGKGCMQNLAAASSVLQTSPLSSIPNSQHQRAMTQGGKSFAAGFASSTDVTTTSGENSWSKFRAPYGFEQKSTLGPAMYISIAIFGFSIYMNDLIYHPPRVVTMLGLMMLLLYVRRK